MLPSKKYNCVQEIINSIINDIENNNIIVAMGVNKPIVKKLTIIRYKNEISKLSGQSGDIKQAKKELNNLRKDKDGETERKLTHVEERTYNEVIGEMLKDTGIILLTKLLRPPWHVRSFPGAAVPKVGQLPPTSAQFALETDSR